MAAKKSEKRQQTEQFGIRLREVERAYLEEAAQKLSDRSPTRVGLGPFLLWAAKEASKDLVGLSFADYEAKAEKRGKGGGR